jgi:hypothetical protein
VTGADVIVIVWLTLSALVGLRRGFAAQVLALAGFAAGAWVGSRLAPYALSDSARAEWEPVAALLGAVIGGALAQAADRSAGDHRRRRRPGRRHGAGACGGLAGRGDRDQPAQPRAAP